MHEERRCESKISVRKPHLKREHLRVISVNGNIISKCILGCGNVNCVGI
jgi:hypothetical protein